MKARPVIRVVIAAALSATLLAALAGCSAGPAPVIDSREVLGTVVTITAYGTDADALRSAEGAAFAEMSALEAVLDPYDPASAIAAFNAAPYEWHALPGSALAIMDRVGSLGVTRQFSPALFGVTRLYGFGGAGSVPSTATLRLAVARSGGFTRENGRARFLQATLPAESSETASATGSVADTMTPGLDFGGAAKGLALDRAMKRLRKARGITGAMITAGSSTSVWGRKPDGEPWRIGIEDPRATGTVVAIVGAGAPDVLNVSTSGDYQQYFERGGVRYHHILDPLTGRPARGMRSLTVYGAISGTDADILSTALFVMGPSAAKEWAQRSGVGLYAIDDLGRVVTVSAPRNANTTFERTATPVK